MGGAPASPVALAAGYVHSLALKPDGTVWAAGYNGSGQLGDGTTTSRLTPVQVAGLSGVTASAPVADTKREEALHALHVWYREWVTMSKSRPTSLIGVVAQRGSHGVTGASMTS